MVRPDVLATIKTEDAALYARIYPDPPALTAADADFANEPLATLMNAAARAPEREATRLLLVPTGDGSTPAHLFENGVHHIALDNLAAQELEPNEEDEPGNM